jgi:two-component system CheB/CheR fusion protein
LAGTIASSGDRGDEGPAPPLPIVGIGASAGGVQALTAFFRAVPADSGMAFVVVTHLGPGRDSLLHDILGQTAIIPVNRVTDGMLVAANEVYVLGAAAALTIEAGRIRVHHHDKRQANPIDVFLASLAQDRAEHAIGVVLSGGGGDGTLGLKAIKEGGGLTVAQGSDGSTPQHPSMPDSAIAACTVDLVLSVEDMPARLVDYVRGLLTLDAFVTGKEEPASPRADSLRDIRIAVCEVLRAQVGHDFSGYKEATFLRRMQRRMQVIQIDDPAGYLDRLRRDAEEVGRLFRDLLIGVTSFFRDADAFEALARTVVPQMLDGRGNDSTVRIWVPGCATGEEAYSIAILMREAMASLRTPPRVQIFATDIDEPALSVARTARYPRAMLEPHVSAARLQQFFVQDGETMVVRRDVRDLCIFSAHSVVRDPPFSRMDLVSCRNLLIYLDGDLQRRVIPVFHYALKPSGHLFLGTSEGINQFGELFTPTERANRIYRRRDHPAVGQVPLWLPDSPHVPPSLFGPGHRAAAGTRSLRHTVDRRLLERFVPAHVVVNREGDVVHYSGGTGRYLEAAAGAPTRDLLAMARRGIRLDLRSLLQEAMEHGRPAQRLVMATDGEDRVQPVMITVEPVGDEAAEPLFLVLFADQGGPLQPSPDIGVRTEGDESHRRLERELRETRDRLQSVVEEYETALEELKSANEELVSMNEELQSTNEELQTAKEEQQSVNEELQTVNGEMRHSIEALDRANGDLRNLFENTRIATIFLDRELVIRSFTPSTTEVFNILPNDIGRPLSDLTSPLDYPELRADIEEVLRTGQPRERPVSRRDQAAHHLARIATYRAGDGRVDGVVATFTEVTSVVRAEAHQRMLVAELNHRVKNSLAVVVGIAVGTLPASPQRENFIARLRALSRAHDVLSQESWTSVRLTEVVRGEAAPFAKQGQERMTFAGPEVSVPPRTALSLTLVLHELTTNAAKHGALSSEEGRVEISWSVAAPQEAEGRLRLLWREIDGPPVVAAARTGFGARVIERDVRVGMRGTLEMDFAADGLRVLLDLPLAGQAVAEVSDVADAAGS